MTREIVEICSLVPYVSDWSQSFKMPCICNAQPSIIFYAMRAAQKITEITAHMCKGADQ